MSLITRPQDLNPSEKTEAEIKQALTAGYFGILASFNQVKTLVWQNPHGLTPQQVFDIFGAEGAKLFQLSSAIVEVLNLVGEGIDAVLPPGVDYTINPDGTVTLS